MSNQKRAKKIKRREVRLARRRDQANARMSRDEKIEAIRRQMDRAGVGERLVVAKKVLADHWPSIVEALKASKPKDILGVATVVTDELVGRGADMGELQVMPRWDGEKLDIRIVASVATAVKAAKEIGLGGR